LETPAAFTTFSSSMTEPTSLPPKRSPSCNTFSPCVTQLACTFLMLVSWVTQGLKVLQLGLRFGGNDVGSVMLEENVVKAAGVSNCTTEEELRHIIRDAGFRPAQRDTLYRMYFLN